MVMESYYRELREAENEFRARELGLPLGTGKRYSEEDILNLIAASEPEVSAAGPTIDTSFASRALAYTKKRKVDLVSVAAALPIVVLGVTNYGDFIGNSLQKENVERQALCKDLVESVPPSQIEDPIRAQAACVRLFLRYEDAAADANPLSISPEHAKRLAYQMGLLGALGTLGWKGWNLTEPIVKNIRMPKFRRPQSVISS